MKCRRKNVLSGILAAVMAFTCPPSNNLAAAVNQDAAQEQLSQETNGEAELGEPAAEALGDQGNQGGKGISDRGRCPGRDVCSWRPGLRIDRKEPSRA